MCLSHYLGTPAIPRLGIKPYVWITECVRGQVSANTTGFPHSIGLSASWRFEFTYMYILTSHLCFACTGSYHFSLQIYYDMFDLV